MNKHTKHQIITDKGGNPAFAVIPYTEYLALVDHDSNDYDEDVFIPHEVVRANVINGDNMVKAWREHLGLTQQDLADRLGTSQPNLAKWEREDANPRKSTLKKIASALNIELAQLDI